jgi:alpha-glucosidase
MIDRYQSILREAAAHRILVNFHGANKPTGEARTWPNELNREAVSGMERRSMQTWAQHDTTIPFTRMLAGHLDFTPMLFGERRRETSWAHQIATAALFTAPLLVYGAHPQAILDNPAVDLIKSIPSTWDETRVLPFSEIGEVAGFARRHGKQWFLVMANGPTARSLDVPLSFLDGGSHRALLVRDREDDPAAVVVETQTVRREDTLTVALRAGGGFVARF